MNEPIDSIRDTFLELRKQRLSDAMNQAWMHLRRNSK